MAYALVIPEAKGVSPDKKKELDEAALKIREFSQDVESSRIESLGLVRLNAGAYQVSLDRGLHGLTHLYDVAKRHKLPLHTVFFDSEPAWIISKF